MTTASEIMLNAQPTRGEAMLALLRAVRDGRVTPEKAYEEITDAMRIVAQTAMDSIALSSMPRTVEVPDVAPPA